MAPAARPIRVIVFITNAISAELAKRALEADKVPFSEVGLIVGRRIEVSWAADCAEVVYYNIAASLKLAGQIKTLGFYLDGSRAVRRWLAAGQVREIYLANIDNLLTNHILQWLRRGGKAKLTVLSEGLMNYQKIGIDDRAGWRWQVKPLVAALLGLNYAIPKNHLSGSFEPECGRVIAFAAPHIQAPPEKVQVLPFDVIVPTAPAESGTVLVVITGIAQWMTVEAFEKFADAFGAFFRSLKAKRVLVKFHPHYPSGGIESRFGDFETITDKRSVEGMAADINAETVVGFCTTALVTLKLRRPDIHCIDFGSDFYCEYAYHGDRSVVGFLAASGIEIVEMGEGA
jgi:hypothetical protein